MQHTSGACKSLCGAGVAHFLSIMGHNDVQTMPLQQRRSQVRKAVSQLVELSRYGVCRILAALTDIYCSLKSSSSLAQPSDVNAILVCAGSLAAKVIR